MKTNKAGPTPSAYSAHVFVGKHVFLEFCEVTLAIRVFKSRFLFTNVMYLDKGYNFGRVTFCRPGHNNEDSILGPLLFLMYINDFGNMTETGRQILFADDATHFDSDYNFMEVLRRVNLELITLTNWFLANRLSINVIKSEGMVFTRRNLYFPLSPLV